MKSIHFLLALIFVTTTFFQCEEDLDDNCLSFNSAPVTLVVGATSAMANQDVLLIVSFTASNGCGQFENFSESVNGNVNNITVNARYEGCVCTQDLPTRTATYTFKKSQPGVYELRFYQTASSYYTHSITVQ